MSAPNANLIPAQTRSHRQAALGLALAGLALFLCSCHRQTAGDQSGGTGDSTAIVHYVDIAQKAGLNFSWKHHAKGPWTNLEAFGCGCAFLDYDNDGWMDILLVGRPYCALFHNNHNGTFTDVTTQAGLKKPGNWIGVGVGDYDNDGWQDLYISGYKCGMLLHNNRHGSFTDVTVKAGLTEKQWGSSAVFFDADGDGKLDLLIGHYVVTGPPYPWYCHPSPKITIGCRPQEYPAEYPKLYHNNGDGTFTDVSARAGLGKSFGKSLAIQVCDYDNDGKPDFYIANDGMPGDMFHNLGDGRFENASVPEGTAYGAGGVPQAGMGVDFADYDRDGNMDMAVSAFSGETYSLYHNLGGVFNVVSQTAGIRDTVHYLGFGLKFVDVDNDGWPDLIFNNGHVYDNIGMFDKSQTFRQPLLLYHNEHNGHFRRLLNAGPGFSTPIVGRGLAVGDIFNDGSQDLLVVDYDGHPLLLHNMQPTGHHWLGVSLLGKSCNRNGYGARVSLTLKDGPEIADCTAAGSYLSSMDPRLHFGLGDQTEAEELKVNWLDGHVSVLHHVPADRYVTIKEE